MGFMSLLELQKTNNLNIKKSKIEVGIYVYTLSIFSF